MPTKTAPVLNSSIFYYENENLKFSRSEETLITGQNCAAGTVLGKITASGKLTILAPAASDGSQNAYGVLMFDCNASAADQKCVIMRREGLVKASAVIWPGGINGTQKATATSQLEALQILIRNDVGSSATGVVS